MSLCVAKSFDVPDHPYIVHLVEFNCDIISPPDTSCEPNFGWPKWTVCRTSCCLEGDRDISLGSFEIFRQSGVDS